MDRIDINQCPKGEGNNGPNRFADTARCKKETTEVKFHFVIFSYYFQNYIIIIYSSVNLYMVGVLEEVVINVVVGQDIVYRALCADLTWVKLLNELQQNNITMDLIAAR